MPRKRSSTEQIITTLRQAESELSRGLRPPQVCQKLGISEQTYYRWRKEYGSLRLDQAKRLKRLVADQALDAAILKEVADIRAREGSTITPTRSATPTSGFSRQLDTVCRECQHGGQPARPNLYSAKELEWQCSSPLSHRRVLRFL